MMLYFIMNIAKNPAINHSFIKRDKSKKTKTKRIKKNKKIAHSLGSFFPSKSKVENYDSDNFIIKELKK